MNREASSFGGDTESGDDESESSGDGVEMVRSEANYIKAGNTPLVSGRAVSTTSRAESSVHSETSFDSKGRRPFGESLADAPATSDSFLHSSNEQFAALRAGEAKRLAEHIPGPLARLFLKDFGVLKRDGRKPLPKQAWYPRRTSYISRCTSRRRIPWNKRCRQALRRLSRCQLGRCKTSSYRQRRRRKCVDHHFVRHLSTLGRLSSMDCLP